VRALARECSAFASPGERKQVAASCYELLLAWAEAEAQLGRLPGRRANEAEAGARKALAILDTARALARAAAVPTPRAYHLRRARYLAQAGEEGNAALERDRAAGLHPRTARDHFLLALESYREDRFDQAARECGLALGEQADHFWACYLQA